VVAACSGVLLVSEDWLAGAAVCLSIMFGDDKVLLGWTNCVTWHCAAFDAELTGLGSTVSAWIMVGFVMGRIVATGVNFTGILAALFEGRQTDSDGVFLTDDFTTGFITSATAVELDDSSLGEAADVDNDVVSSSPLATTDDDDEGNDSGTAAEQGFLVHDLSLDAAPVTAVFWQGSGCTELNCAFVDVKKQLSPENLVTVSVAAAAVASTASLLVDSSLILVEIWS